MQLGKTGDGPNNESAALCALCHTCIMYMYVALNSLLRKKLCFSHSTEGEEGRELDGACQPLVI